MPLSTTTTTTTTLTMRGSIRVLPRLLVLLTRAFPLLLALPLLYFRPDWWYRLLLTTLEGMGPCFIKLGQWMATRRDLVPPRLCERLSMLNSRAPQHSLQDTLRILQEDLGDSPDNLFAAFAPTPLASGAVAQIHEATLLADDTSLPPQRVVVKVLHPGVRHRIERDLEALRVVVMALQWISRMDHLQLQRNVDDFAGRMLAQCDLKEEAVHLQRFARNFDDMSNIRFPQPIAHLASPRVLVESFEHGVCITPQLIDELDEDLRVTLAAVGIDAYLKMILVDNFVHADLHPGNILLDDGRDPSSGSLVRQPALVLLDCGLVTALSARDKDNFHALMEAVLGGDGRRAARLMAQDQHHLTPREVDAFCDGVNEMVELVAQRPIAEIDIGLVFGRIMDLGRCHRVMLESNFTTLVLGSIVLEGLGRQLNPRINIIDQSKPFLVSQPDLVRAYVRSSLNRKLHGLFLSQR